MALWTKSLLGMFVRSPIKAVNEHMQHALKAAESLEPFIQAVLRNDWEAAASMQEQICQWEQSADEKKQQLYLMLHQDLWLPVSRYDMLSLVSAQDSIANQSKDIAGLVLGRSLQFPQPIQASILHYVQAAIAACVQAQQVVGNLEGVMRGGFSVQRQQAIAEMVRALDDMEHVVDEQQIALRKELMAVEDQHSPIAVMFLYKVLDRIGALADCAHHVGGKLMLLVT